MINTSLLKRLEGIEEKHKQNTDEIRKNLNYARYLIEKQYCHLTKEQKIKLGQFLGLTEKKLKEIQEINNQLINLRVGLSYEVVCSNQKK